MINAATSNDPKIREATYEHLICNLQEMKDKKGKNWTTEEEVDSKRHIIIVWAAYYSVEQGHELQKSASSFFEKWKEGELEYKLSTLGHKFADKLEKYHNKSDSKLDSKFVFDILDRSISEMEERLNERQMDGQSLSFESDVHLFAVVQKMGTSSFEVIDCMEEEVTVFSPLAKNDAIINKRMLALNGEVARGAYLNNIEKSLAYLKSPQGMLQWLMGEAKDLLKRYLRSDQMKLIAFEKEIIKSANAKLKADPSLRYDVYGKKLSLLNLAEVAYLMEVPDPKEIFKRTGLEIGEQQQLYQQIGRYLEILSRTIHINNILQLIDNLEAAPDGRKDLVMKKIGFTMLQPHVVVEKDRPLIQLNFQAKTRMIGTKGQAESLSKLLMQNIFVQKRQGDGKTVFFGPYLTRALANGSELMIFVPSYGQYVPTVNSMGANQSKLFRQEHHVIEFSDGYKQFTKPYLKRILLTLQTTISDRHFVIMNNEITLRTMRGKYIKTAIEIYNNPLMTSQEKVELGSVNAILMEILALIRSKGHMILDEVHESTHPKNTTNLALSNPTFLQYPEGDILASIILKAASLLVEDGKPLIDFVGNHQSQLSQAPQKRERVIQELVQFCVEDEKWCALTQMTGLSTAQKNELIAYLMKKDAKQPTFVGEAIKNTPHKKGVKTPPMLLLMTRKMFAKDWLMNAFSDPTYERYQIVHKKDQVPIAVPCTFNMQPAERSEYSNPYHMAIQTMVGAIVQGLLLNQIPGFLSFYKYRALTDAESEDIAIEETKIAQDIKRLLDIDIRNSVNEENQILLQSKLLSSNPEIIKFVLNYILNRTITKKPLFQEQVSSNGVSAVTMSKRVGGYSGTIDTPHLDIVMNYKGEKVEVEREFGTDGRTLDLVLKRHNVVYVMGNEAIDLFNDVLTRLESNQQSRFKVIIDAGCHFRGILPNLVAEMMLEYQKMLNLSFSYVVFYNLDHELCYVSKNAPKEVKLLKSQHLKGIAKELNTTVDQLGCYLSQDKATGTNFKFLPGTLSLLTATENTQAYLTIQGLRRMRDADTSHEIIHCIQKGCLDKMAELLDKPDLLKLNIGKVKEKTFINNLLTFVYANRLIQLPREDYQLCVFNLYNIAQQYLLDRCYFNNMEHIVFTKAVDLFKEDVSIDFIQEEGLPRKPHAQREHLTQLMNTILKWVELAESPADEIAIMKITMKDMIESFLPDLPPTIELATIDKAEMATIDGTMIQMQQSKKEQEQLEKKEQYFIVKDDGNWQDPMAEHIPLTRKILFSPEFPKQGNEETFPILALDAILEAKFPNKWEVGIVDRDVLVTKNYMQAKENKVNIGDSFEKPLKHFLLVRKEGKFQLVVLSIEDAVNVATLFSEDYRLPIGTDMWLLRPSGDLAWSGPSHYNKKDFVSNPQVARLCVQALFINGQYQYLDKPYWYNALKEWLANHPMKHLAILYFNEVALKDASPEDYENTNLSKLLDTIYKS